MMRIFSLSFFRTYAAWLLLPVLSLFFAKLASSADMMIIAMGLSSFIGIILLSKPTWNVNIILIVGLLSGLATLFFDSIGGKMVWGVSILGFLLLAMSLYRLLIIPNLIRSTPIFVWLLLLFLFYSIVDTVFQLHSPKEMITAIKRYYQTWGLLFALCWLDFNKKDIEYWCKAVLTICLLQAPFCLHQLLVLVPIRNGLMEANPGLVPIDVVAGTFGATMLGGGNNAEMATVLIMLFAFLLTRYQAKALTGKQTFWLSFILLSPLTMGETKIVVIFFPYMLVVLYRKEILTRPMYAVLALIFGGLFTGILINVYMIMTNSTLDELIFETLSYNLYDRGYGNYYLNRTTVLTFWAQHQSLADPISFLFGNGLGSAKEGSNDTGDLGGHIAALYPMYGIALTGASILLWELGITGLFLYWIIIIAAWRCASRLMKKTTDPVVYADVAAIQTSLALFGIYPLYRDTLLSVITFQIVFAAMLGYLAWLHKQHARYKS